MKNKKPINLKIRILQINDITDAYIKWYSNDSVVKFSENQYGKFTYEGQCAYINACLLDSNTDLYGIFDGDLHVGNIEIRGLESIHKCASVSYVVGNISYLCRGVGTFAVSSVVRLAQKKYKLNKLIAGLAEGNIGSKKVLERNNFVLEGRRKKHLFFNGEYHTQLDYGLILGE